MAQFDVNVQIFEQFEDKVSSERLRGVAEFVLNREEADESDSLSIVVTDDDTMRELNRQHRGVDETTDVLSFAFDNEGVYYGENDVFKLDGDSDFVLPPGESAGLGELIISYPQVAKQAEEVGRSVDEELVHMLTHGILHLLGYDHMDDEDEAEMKSKESAVLERVESHG